MSRALFGLSHCNHRLTLHISLRLITEGDEGRCRRRLRRAVLQRIPHHAQRLRLLGGLGCHRRRRPVHGYAHLLPAQHPPAEAREPEEAAVEQDRQLPPDQQQCVLGEQHHRRVDAVIRLQVAETLKVICLEKRGLCFVPQTSRILMNGRAEHMGSTGNKDTTKSKGAPEFKESTETTTPHGHTTITKRKGGERRIHQCIVLGK